MKKDLLDNAECGFCGADNNGKYDHIHIYRNTDGYYVKCNNCEARTPIFQTSVDALECWRDGGCTIPVQSEAEIYKECVNLMHGLVEEFGEWLEWQGVEVTEEERFRIHMHPTEIVNRLFLWHTKHSGGTSTRAKCHELGIEDCTRSIEFKVADDEEED